MYRHPIIAILAALLITGCASAPPAGVSQSDATVTIRLDLGTGAAIQPAGVPTDPTHGAPGITRAELLVSVDGQALAFDASGNLTDGAGEPVLLTGGSVTLRLPQGTYDFSVDGRDDDDNQLADGQLTDVAVQTDTTLAIALTSFVGDATLLAPHTILPNQVIDVALLVHPPGRTDLVVPTTDYTATYSSSATIVSESPRGLRLVVECEPIDLTAEITDTRGGASITRNTTLPVAQICSSYAGSIGVDLIPPYLELDAHPSSVLIGTTVTLTGTVNDAQTGVASVDLYDGPIHLATATIDEQTTPHSYAITFAPTEERTYALTLLARDHAGNETRTLTVVIANPGVAPTTFATRAGGTSTDVARGVSTLSDGSAIITGYFQGTATFGDTTLTATGGTDVFVARVNPDGTWAWATRAGGTNNEFAHGISTLSDGSAIVTGYFDGTATFGTTTLTSAGNADVFVAKVYPNGTWAWATRAGGTNIAYADGVSTFSDGSAIISGVFRSSAGFGTTTLTSAGIEEVFIAKVDSTGTWSRANSGAGTLSAARGVSTLASGSAIITGYFTGTTTFGGTSLTSAGGRDVFVAKLDPNGNWEWATRAGGTNVDDVQAVSALIDGGAIITGYFQGAATFGATTVTSAGSSWEVFAAKANPDGTWAWATSAGGTTSVIGASNGIGYGISTLSDGSAMVTGHFFGTATFGDTTVTSSTENADVFVAKLNPNGTWGWANRAGGSGSDFGWGVSTLSDGAALLTGTFQAFADFAGTTLASAGGRDVYVAKIGPGGDW